jgi:fluoride exporter
VLQKMLIVGLGGFVGANARYLLGEWAYNRWGPSFPVGTFLINVTGSFVLGLFAALSLELNWNPTWRLLVAVGFLGAYTTFSTFEYESLQLIAHGGRYREAAVNLIGSVLVGLAAAWVGVALARLLLRLR